MKFSEIARGHLTRRAVPLPLGEGPLPLPQLGEDGKVTYPPVEGAVLVDVRVLSAAEEADALADARAFAVSKGLETPREGDTIYDLAVMVSILAVACVDHDSPLDRPEPFFAGAHEARSLDRERIVLLYEQQVQLQSATSPRRMNLSHDEYVGYVTALAVAEDDLPFDPLPLATQRVCMRSMARQLLLSPPGNWLSTAGSSPAGASTTPTTAER